MTTYVGDPFLVLTDADRGGDVTLAGVALLRSAPGFRLSFHNAERGRDIDRIGGTFRVDATGMRVAVKASIPQDVDQQVNE